MKSIFLWWWWFQLFVPRIFTKFDTYYNSCPHYKYAARNLWIRGLFSVQLLMLNAIEWSNRILKLFMFVFPAHFSYYQSFSCVFILWIRTWSKIQININTETTKPTLMIRQEKKCVWNRWKRKLICQSMTSHITNQSVGLWRKSRRKRNPRSGIFWLSVVTDWLECVTRMIFFDFVANQRRKCPFFASFLKFKRREEWDSFVQSRDEFRIE